ncbi:glycine--tRNA ligase subunit alpha [candidate division WOR-3 bacterium 4484_100]|uniref:Glycine--tRNA ligase alpha subunit n=1 Tax=candidate division WOR-3 bacterium 4484_100 TaxID=1936077 RepID=A0A1V4QER2_UNCW3|nr:MAG: glycine--tRNA ligase subunit alpha [candidate division WOR-3 bacterium 4484_100]
MKKIKTFENVIIDLKHYWQKQGCLIFEPYNSEVGAGTFNPATFLRILGPEKWNVCYVEISKRPRDGRYCENPLRFQQYYQFQVIMKPSLPDIQKLYLQSLESLGFKLNEHEVKFVEDDWESPTLGAWGLGWEVWLDGLEITQFTYFQQAGGIDLEIVPVEITYGLERIVMALQNVESILDIKWNSQLTWADVYKENEIQFSRYNFEYANPEFLRTLFNGYEDEARRLFDAGLVYPGYDCAIKCSHIFNMLEARGTISISERANLIGRVRALASRAAQLYLANFNREEKTDD